MWKAGHPTYKMKKEYTSVCRQSRKPTRKENKPFTNTTSTLCYPCNILLFSIYSLHFTLCCREHFTSRWIPDNVSIASISLHHWVLLQIWSRLLCTYEKVMKSSVLGQKSFLKLLLLLVPFKPASTRWIDNFVVEQQSLYTSQNLQLRCVLLYFHAHMSYTSSITDVWFLLE